MGEKPSIINDIKTSGKYIIGVIAFTTAVSALLIDIFQFNKQWTVGITMAVTLLIICSIMFIARVEHKEEALLNDHIEKDKHIISNIESSLEELKHIVTEVRKDTLRIQLSRYIKNEPKNTDTILTIANEYFVVYKGNWIAHNEFLNWAKENDVNIPHKIADFLEEANIHND